MGFRFVVLHHTGALEPHFDLLMEMEGEEKLWAWRVFRAPGEWEGGNLGAVRIRDHRKVYMTYEGAISGGRGEVKRVAEGRGTVVELGAEWLRVRMVVMGREIELDLPAAANE
jgi:hypothetical protein